MNSLILSALALVGNTNVLIQDNPDQTLCAQGIESIQVQQKENPTLVRVEIFQRGSLGVFGNPWTFFGLNCMPGFDFATKYRIPDSSLGVAVNFPGKPMLQNPFNGCFTQSGQSLEATADIYAEADCHTEPAPWVAVKLNDPDTWAWREVAGMDPFDQYQVFEFTDPDILAMFDGTGTVDMEVSQGFHYDLQWSGCVTPYSFAKQHIFEIYVTVEVDMEKIKQVLDILQSFQAPQIILDPSDQILLEWTDTDGATVILEVSDNGRITWSVIADEGHHDSGEFDSSQCELPEELQDFLERHFS